MPKPIRLDLTAEQRKELERIRDRHPKAYMRERAAALLKIADGRSGREVALHGLLKRRHPDTIYGWVRRYKKEGVKGLRVRAGRGRKPAFSPQHADEEEAREVMLHIVRREPRTFGEERSRWTLASLRRVSEWLAERSLSGIWQILRRLGIHYKRARSYIHSPDPDYEGKLAQVQAYIRQVKEEPERYVILFQDELTYYRQPSEAPAYEAAGKEQPLARRSYHKDSQRRIAATLDALTGQVVYMQKSRIGTEALVAFYEQVVQAYPERIIYMVQDNWPVHFHPDVLAALEPQSFKWPVRVPWNWPTEPSSKARHLNLPIRIVMLPTYASWANPIEKLWRWLKQEVLHLHPYAEKWKALWNEVDNFLTRFEKGSDALLRYVGLTGNSNLYGPALSHIGRPPSPLPN